MARILDLRSASRLPERCLREDAVPPAVGLALPECRTTGIASTTCPRDREVGPIAFDGLAASPGAMVGSRPRWLLEDRHG